MIGKKKLKYLYNVCNMFVNKNKIRSIKQIEGGHINDTYLVEMDEAIYILQKINNTVFTSPFGLMHNIRLVTEYIKKNLIYDGMNPNRKVLSIIKTKLDSDVAVKDDKYYRMLEYIKDTKTYNYVCNDEVIKEMGRVVGNFQRLLNGFNSNVLDETIHHFHDTTYRYKQLQISKMINCKKRLNEVKDKINYFDNLKNYYNIITDKLKNKQLPLRVIHNDTKINNILFCNNTNKALLLIDLDTVMKGSICYDYGDALRLGASNAKEDEKDLTKVYIKLDYIYLFTNSFLKEVKGIITKEEIKMLYYGYFLMCVECAMRFLTDYLNGDVYFKINYPKHNYDRFINQMMLSKCVEKNKYNIIKIINQAIINNKYPKTFIIDGEI